MDTIDPCESELISHDVSPDGISGEAGQYFTVTCPRCQTTMTCAEHQWWKSECYCKLWWTVDIRAVGRP